jgi:predicted phosphodiesterase
MFSKCLLSLYLLLSFNNTFAADVFKISPYTLVHTNGQLLLNFQLNDDQNLIIEDDNTSVKSNSFKKDQQYQIELGQAVCGTEKSVRILSESNKSVLFSKSFPTKICNNTKSNNDFVFGFISDTQLNKDKHENVAKVIAYHHSIEPLQFIINGGDVVNDGDHEDQWFDFFEGGKAYLMDIPQIAAVGNHDYRGSHGFETPKLFQKYLRWEGAPKFGELFFDFPDFQLAIFNSNFFRMTTPEAMKAISWLEVQIKAADKANKTLIIATHFPIWSSSSNKYTSQSVMIMKKYLMPALEKYKVPFILSGHTHMYERSFKDGVHYIVAGAAGGRPNKPSGHNPYVKFFDKDARTFTKIKYSNKVFTIESYNEENVLIDSLVIAARK